MNVRRWVRRSALPIAVLLLAYGALALLPDLRRAAGGLFTVTPWALAAAGVLKAASLAAFSGISVMLLRPCRTPRFATLLRIDLAVYGLTRLLPAAPATGGALRLRLLDAAGAPRGDAEFVATVEGIGSALLLYVMLGVALLVSIPLHGEDPGYVTAAAIGAALVAAAAVGVRGLTRGSRRTRRAVHAVAARVPGVDADALCWLSLTFRHTSGRPAGAVEARQSR